MILGIIFEPLYCDLMFCLDTSVREMYIPGRIPQQICDYGKVKSSCTSILNVHNLTPLRIDTISLR